MKLAPDQIEFIDHVLEGQNVFLTGKAGTGKSTALKVLTKQLKDKNLLICAPTGLAAQHIKGITLHRAFGLEIGILDEEWKPTHKKAIESTLRALECLIIDEISMVRADVLDAVDKVLCFYRNSDQPFGGVQLILIGDLYQLPPVIRSDEVPYFKRVYGGGYFFLSHSFKRLNCKKVELTTIFRQTDRHFIKALNAIRDGHELLNAMSLLNENVKMPSANTTFLTTTNKLADVTNQSNLQQIKSTTFTFYATKSGNVSAGDVPCEKTLHLKRGARVIFLANGDEYVNGDTGTITFLDDDEIEVKCDKGPTITVGYYTWNIRKAKYDVISQRIVNEVVGSVQQVPLKLGWACTIHKAQGMTLDRVHLDMGDGAFSHGQLYVALSRCRSLSGLTLKKDLKISDSMVDPLVRSFNA